MEIRKYGTKEIYDEVLIAESRIRPHILKTPLLLSRPLSKFIDGKVYLKLENEQHTGSFKARGSLNKLMSLNANERAQGVITASTGNHALGFSRALEITGVEGTVYLPPHASKAKVEALRNYPVQLEFHGNSSLETELHARSMAEQENKIWVSPYNDFQILAGQGTIGIELAEQAPNLDYCFITVGGGGLISGVGAYLKTAIPTCNIIACQPKNSHEMTRSLAAGKIVDMPEELETLSDGSAGGIEKDSITFPICQSIVDDSLLCDEESIAEGITYILKNHKKIVEGSAAVTVAALMNNKDRFRKKTVVLVLCGGNIELKIIHKLLKNMF